MSDEQTPEAGSRRRRREIREARERELAAARERESAVRRLSSASTAADSPPLFDQEAQRKAAHLDNAGQGTAAKTPGIPAVFRRAAPSPPGQQDTPKASAKSKLSFLSRRSQHQTSQQNSTASEGTVPTPAPIPSDSPAPRVSNSPSTPFEQVVAGSPISPEPSDTEFEHDEGAEYYSEHHEQDAFDPFGDYSEWDEDYEGEIERDEDGHSVLVGASGFGRGYQTVIPMDGRVSLRVLKQRRAKRRRRNITLTFALAGFAVMVIGVVVIINSLLGRGGPQDYEAVSGDAITFVIHPGEGFESVRNRLVDEEIIASADAFNTALSEMETEPAVHEGRYPLHEQMPAAEAVDILFGEDEPAYTIYIEPNWWIDETFAEIAEKTPHSVQDLEAAAADPTAFGLPERAESLEGYLPPGEHEFPIEDEMTAEEILQELTGITLRRLEDLGITDPEEQFETVIVASLITAEANHNDPDSYPVMAGAIQNRLEPDNPETDGYLYIDATNNYGLGEHDIHGATQLDEDSPWNSRTQPGLPPGPVGAPLRATLEAAAQPQENDYNYWVTVDLETGQTQFSETYEQHRVYEQQFLDWCDDHPGVCSPADVESAEEEFSE